jgi:hypothetical protein
VRQTSTFFANHLHHSSTIFWHINPIKRVNQMEVSMFRRGFFVFRLLAALLLMGVLIIAGFMVFRAGEAQGFALGAASAAGADSAFVVPPQAVTTHPLYMRGWTGYYGMHFSPFGPLFGLLCFGGFAFFFLFFVVGGFFRHRAWHHHGPGGPEHVHWGKHFHGEPPPEHAREQPKDPGAPPA